MQMTQLLRSISMRWVNAGMPRAPIKMRGVSSLMGTSFHHCVDSGIGSRCAAGGALGTMSLSLPSSLITLITRRLGLGRGTGRLGLGRGTVEEEEDAEEEEIDAEGGVEEEVEAEEAENAEEEELDAGGGADDEVVADEAGEAEEELDEADGPPTRPGRKCACRKFVNPGPGPAKTPFPGDLRAASPQRVNPVPLREPCQE